MRDDTINMEASINKRVVLAIAVMSSFLTPFTSSSINIALPSIRISSKR